MKRKTKKLIIGIVVVALLLGSAGVLIAIFNNDTREIGSSAFSVGAIDENGAFVESETSICTKELIECQGLAIEPDFDATGTYQVFYYSMNKEFVGKTDIMNSAKTIYERGDEFPFAKYCRIMITPTPELDEDGVYKIGYFDVSDIVSTYSITVNKKQNFSIETLLAGEEDLYNGCGMYCNVEGYLDERSAEGGFPFYTNLTEVDSSDRYFVIRVASEMLSRYDVPRLYVSETKMIDYIGEEGDYCTEFNDIDCELIYDDGVNAYLVYDLEAPALAGVNIEKVGFITGANSTSSAEMYLIGG